MAPRDDLTVVIVNWERSHATLRTVAKLRRWRRPPSLLVIDNGSGRDEVEQLRGALDEGELMTNSNNVGFGAANNLALNGIRSRYALLLNNDARIEEEAADALLRFAERTPEAGVVGPLVVQREGGGARVTAGGRDIARHARTHLHLKDLTDRAAGGEPFEVDYVPGTAALLPVDLVRELGGFDESYFFSGEMADLCRRATEAGRESWIVPTVEVDHDLDEAGTSRETLYRYYSLRNRFLFIDRRLPAVSRDAARRRWTARGLGQIVRALLGGRLRKAHCLWLALLDGRAGRFGRAPAGIAR